MNEKIKMEQFHGVIDVVESVRDYEYEVVSGASEISDFYPKQFQLKPLTIKDQGAWSACVGCSTASMLEAHYGEEFSAGWNYGRFRDENEDYIGMVHTKALEFLKDIGGLPKSFFDLLVEMPEIKDACKQFPEFDDIAKKYRISGYVKMNNGDTKTGRLKDLQIKKAITESIEPLFAISPYAFGSSHAIIIIGWDDETNEYIIQNSWGESWGENGVGRVDKADIREVYQFLYSPIKLPFIDVQESDWFYDDVKQAYLSGLITGRSVDKFDPYASITRAEACVMFNRLMKKVDSSLESLNKLISLKHFYNQLGEEKE